MRLHKALVALVAFLLVLVMVAPQPRKSGVSAQQPTGSIPTVTGTPTGPTVAVDPSLQSSWCIPVRA